MGSYKIVETDVLILGTEAAGARAAIEAHNQRTRVLMVTKSIMGKSGTTLKAVFSVSGAFGFADPEDNSGEHLKDMVKGGRGVCNQELAGIVAEDGPRCLDELGKWGVKWDKEPDGRSRQVKMYGHSRPRSLSVGFKVGLEWTKVFKKVISSSANISVWNDFFVWDLLVSDNPRRVVGAIGINIISGEVVLIKAKAIIIATGGLTYLYKFQSTTPEATGDGIAMAFRAGVELVDIEFVQFFPLGLLWPKRLEADEVIPAFMRTWLRARLYNSIGERFMIRYDPENMELSDRDILSIAIYKEVKAGRGTPHGGVWLDATFLEDKIIETVINDMTPNLRLRSIDLIKYGLDLRKVPIEVAPSAHFTCGGVVCNHNFATSLAGLYVCGEAVGGVHGANRLPGDSLVETQVSGYRAGRFAAEFARQADYGTINQSLIEPKLDQLDKLYSRKKGLRPNKVIEDLRALLTNGAGIVRTKQGLENTLSVMAKIKEEDLPQVSLAWNGKTCNLDVIRTLELINMLTVAECIALSALLRNESRGNHFRDDFPQISPSWVKNIYLRLEGNKVVGEARPIKETKYPGGVVC